MDTVAVMVKLWLTSRPRSMAVATASDMVMPWLTLLS